MAPSRQTFADFMEQALYGPDGYYASGRAKSGRKGDYFTAPDTGPTFGLLLALIFQNWQRELGLTPFHLVEIGAGEGGLAQHITRALSFPYIAIERSPSRRKTLEAQGLKVFASLDDLAAKPVSGCLFGNELLDAFPVHRVRMHDGQLEEAFVENHELTWHAPSTPRLAAYLQRIGVTLPDDYETEINLAMSGWFQKAAAALRNGLVLLIDYGRPAHEYYAPERDRGTLRSFQDHQVSSRIISSPGQVDLTSDVDFTSAALDAKSAGFEPLAYMELGSFLIQGAHALKVAPAALQYLIHPEGLGSAFHVLILGKGIAWEPSDFPHNRLARLGLPKS